MADTPNLGASGARLTDFPKIPATELRRLEAQCWQFEAACQSGQPPQLEQFVAAAAPTQRAYLLRELLFLEREYRQRRGENPKRDDYAARFPSDGAVIDEVFAAELPLSSSVSLSNIAPQCPVRSDGDSLGEFPQVPGFKILDVLGRGGMGVVYRAHEESLQRTVALKMIRAGAQASVEDLLRFRIEGETVARLQHPHIVQIFKVGEHQEQPFLALEYVDGGSLKQRLQRGPLPIQSAAILIEQVALAVHFAHQQGIVHRDLKPANVLLNADGQPKITDFGLAKSLGEDKDLTQSGTIIGTPNYMAPEQAAGNARRVGPASDIYALGAVLYELLGGKPPFAESHTAEAMVRLITEDAPSLVRMRPGLPRDLVTICERCMEREPGRRYPSAEALAEDLRRYRQGEPIAARPVGVAERAWKWAQRRPAVAALSGVAILLALLGGAGILWQWQAALVARDEAGQRAREALEASKDAERKTEIAEAQLYLSHIAQARLQIANSNCAAAELLLDQCPPARRGWEWHYLRGLLHGDLRTTKAHDGGLFVLKYSPDGKWLASAFFEVKIWDADTGDLVRTLPRSDLPAHTLSFREPDGKYLAAGYGDGTVRIWDPSAGTLVQTIPARDKSFPVAGVAFLPGTTQLAVGSADQAVRFWDVVTGKECRPSMRHTGAITAVVASPNGRRLASSGMDGTRIWDLDTGKQATLLPYRAYGVSFSPDGTVLGVIHGQVAKLWDATPGRELHTFGGHVGSLNGATFSPDGFTFVTAGVDSLISLWNTRSGELQGTRVGHKGLGGSCTFHPSGRILATADSSRGEIKLWDMTRRSDLSRASHFDARYDVPPPDVVACAFVPGSHELMTVRSGGQMQVRNARTAVLRSEQLLPVEQPVLYTPNVAALTADGRRVAVLDRQSAPRVRIWDTATKKLLFEAPEAPGLLRHQLVLSRDGRFIAIVEEDAKSQRQVRLWQVDSGALVQSFALGSRPTDIIDVAGPALSADGRWLAAEVLGSPPRFVVWNIATGSERWSAALDTALAAVVFSDDTRYLAAAERDGRIQVWETESGKQLFERPVPGLPGVRALAISPDGRLLAAHSGSRMRLIDLHSGQEVLNFDSIFRHFSGDRAYEPLLAWSPDGEWLAGSDYFRNVLVFDAVNRESPEAKKQMRTESEARAFAWHITRAEACLDWALLGPGLQSHRRLLEDAAPPDPALRWERAFLQARRSQWTRVGADIAHESNPRRQLLMLQACACLQNGDTAGYRQRCARLAKAAGPPIDVETRARLLQVCLLAPEAVEPRPLLELARAVHAAHPQSDPYGDHLLGMAYYRVGKLDEAIKLLEEIQQTHPNWNKQALNEIALAALHQQKGDTAKHARLLAQAQTRLGMTGKLAAETPPRWNWTEWLQAHRLHAEATPGR
jgi:WD40 repeat protein